MNELDKRPPRLFRRSHNAIESTSVFPNLIKCEWKAPTSEKTCEHSLPHPHSPFECPSLQRFSNLLHAPTILQPPHRPRVSRVLHLCYHLSPLVTATTFVRIKEGLRVAQAEDRLSDAVGDGWRVDFGEGRRGDV